MLHPGKIGTPSQSEPQLVENLTNGVTSRRNGVI